VSREDDWPKAAITPNVMDIINTKVKPNKMDFECLELLMACISKFSLFIYYELSFLQGKKQLTPTLKLLFGNILMLLEYVFVIR
jgi:hypothetical protein